MKTMTSKSTPESDRPETASESPSMCERCDLELVTIRMTVDDSDLVMESCQKCDTRRWQLAGQRIDLQHALEQVSEHAGRRR